MNEPHRGYISLPSMHEFDYNTDLHLNDIRTLDACAFEANSRKLIEPQLLLSSPSCWALAIQHRFPTGNVHFPCQPVLQDTICETSKAVRYAWPMTARAIAEHRMLGLEIGWS